MSIGYFIAITILMIGACVFLKVHRTAPKKFFEFIENFFIFLDEFQKKSWFNFCSALDLLFRIRIFYINCKTSLSVGKTNNIILVYLFHMQ